MASCVRISTLDTTAASLRQYDIRSIDSLMQTAKRPAIVFFYTGWCTYCENMKLTTFRNQEVCDILNKNYYFFAFNAESKIPVVFERKTYLPESKGHGTGTHELAKALAAKNGKIAFPATVILNPDYEIRYRCNAYLSIEDFKILLDILN